MKREADKLEKGKDQDQSHDGRQLVTRVMGIYGVQCCTPGGRGGSGVREFVAYLSKSNENR